MMRRRNYYFLLDSFQERCSYFEHIL